MSRDVVLAFSGLFSILVYITRREFYDSVVERRGSSRVEKRRIVLWLITVFCRYICSVFVRKVRGSSILVEANLHLAVKLQPDLIIRAIQNVASILKEKLKLR